MYDYEFIKTTTKGYDRIEVETIKAIAPNHTLR